MVGGKQGLAAGARGAPGLCVRAIVPLFPRLPVIQQTEELGFIRGGMGGKRVAP